MVMSKQTNFMSFQSEIVAGSRRTFDGWVMAGDECFRRFGGNASAYAKRVVEQYGDRVTENTIRQYVGAVVAGIKRYDSVHNMVTLYDAEYAHRSIESLRGFVGNGEKRRGAPVKKANKQPKYVGSVRRSLRKYEGKKLTADVIEEIVSSLR
jgi:hypothetical protein